MSYLVRAGQPDRGIALTIWGKHALDQIETQHFGKDLLHFRHIRPIEQRMVEADWSDTMFPLQ